MQNPETRAATPDETLSAGEQSAMMNYASVQRVADPEYRAPTAEELGSRLGLPGYPELATPLPKWLDPNYPGAVDEGVGDVGAP